MTAPVDLRSLMLQTPLREKRRLDPVRAAVALGGFTAAINTGWALTVATGLAQPLVDMTFRMHFIEPAWRIAPFNLGGAVLLVLFAALAGGLLGFLFAVIWNAADA